MTTDTNISINLYNNDLYELLYVGLDGKINKVKKELWLSIDKFDVIDTNSIVMSPNIIVSKITQLNTGEFLFLGTDCNVYKMSSNFTNPVIVSSNQFSSLTQLSNYKILLTKKNGKMYIVDDVTNFDSTIKEFFDDSTTYCSVKQTASGYVVAIDGTQCGSAWRFDLTSDGKLINKTKINLDETFTNRTTIFLPDQQSLLNLNCNSRYKDRIYKYDYSDQIIKTKYDFRCGEDEEYEPFNKKCYKKCPTGYISKKDDIVSCWEKCNEGDVDVGALCREGCKSGYRDIAGVCWNNKRLTYDIGVGIPPSYSCPTGFGLEGLKCIKDPPDGYKRLPGDYTTYWLNEPTSYTKDSKQANQDNSACDGLSSRTVGVGTCSGWDSCNSKTPKVCTKLCKSCTYDNYTWGCNAERCGREADVCAGGTCIATGGGNCSTRCRSCRLKCGCGLTTSCDPIDPCGSRTPRTCSPGPAKCCADGLKTTLTGINCDKCGTYDSCTGDDCVGAVVTRKAPRTCPSGYNFDSGDPLKIGLCYENCRDGWESRPGDIISCWNKKPTSIIIPPSNVINASPSCNSDREYRDLMCYKKCEPGYIPAATNCSLPINEQSYVPKTYAKKSISRGQPSDAGVPEAITCASGECCRFDLAFYNPNWVKPPTLILPSIPIQSGLVGFYNADSFRSGVWYDLTPSNNNVVQLGGNFSIGKNYITGNVQSTILFPTQILPQTFTMFSIARYNYRSQTNMEENNLGRILTGYNNPDWFSGFDNKLSGVSSRVKPITQIELSAFDDKWVFSTDTNLTYRANGFNYTKNQLGDLINTSTQLSINMSPSNITKSDFSIGCVIVYNRILTDNEITDVENWLTSQYSDLWEQTYTKTFSQLGYSCFDNRIGKVSDDYTKYEFASYNNGPLSCEWLNLPEKNNLKSLTCNSTTNINYEPFTSLNLNLDFDYLFYLLIIFFIFILVLDYKKNNK